jgi:hypothetical protein
MGKSIKNICIWRFGTWFEGLLNVISLGHSTQIAGWIALKFFNTHDCGCARRKRKWDEFFGCNEGIKLN